MRKDYKHDNPLADITGAFDQDEYLVVTQEQPFSDLVSLHIYWESPNEETSLVKKEPTLGFQGFVPADDVDYVIREFKHHVELYKEQRQAMEVSFVRASEALFFMEARYNKQSFAAGIEDKQAKSNDPLAKKLSANE